MALLSLSLLLANGLALTRRRFAKSGPSRSQQMLTYFWDRTLACALGLAVACFSLALSQQAKEAEPAIAKLYKQHCQSCHMPGGNARAKPLNLADGIWKHGGAKKDVINTITNGVPPTAMKGFKEKLTPKQIEEMAAYVLTFEKKAAAAKTGAKE